MSKLNEAIVNIRAPQPILTTPVERSTIQRASEAGSNVRREAR